MRGILHTTIALGAILSPVAVFAQDQSFTPRVNVTWFDTVYFNHFNTVEMSQAARTMVNLFLGWTSPDDSWTATAYVKNLTDDKYKVGANTNLGLLGFSRTAAYGPPRTFGVSLTKLF